ncbi:uncharacterized protein F4807DRAFT_442058 [Annulohypoxylon truncatum]|uniref:uncharacterized protein n=1 Tax=Annulohypoxylon truncatum TaxID=327061 RepID=UPI00200784D8|nr:uncharacterized protein F4807DRAFT_442058 [Annulohypoxylon truncatum]KAI1205725.1 hypothetical protein F4807DRAFT_442058 [Annulohypoxylon truncatum]
MFGSWRVNPNGDHPTTFRNSPAGRKACKNCRARKVKCTGELSGCQRCETLGTECAYTTGSSKRRRSSPDEAAKKNGKPAAEHPGSDVTRPDATTGLTQHPPSDPNTTISDFGFDVSTEPVNCESDTFVADMEQWSLFPAFGPDTTTSATGRSVFSPISNTSRAIDMSFWNDTSPPNLGVETQNSTMTQPRRATTGSTNTSHIGTTASSPQFQQQAEPEMEMEMDIDIQIQRDTPRGALAVRPVQTYGRGQQACNCLERIVLLINELESNTNDIYLEDDHGDHNGNNGEYDDEEEADKADGNGSAQNRRSLDSALGLHKETLRYGELMRQCEHCSARVETRMMLLLLTNRLVALCADMVSTYSRKTPETLYELTMAITVGEYEVDSNIERGAVLRELIGSQLRALHEFATCLSDYRQPQGASFIAAKNRVMNLLKRLQASNAA